MRFSSSACCSSPPAPRPQVATYIAERAETRKLSTVQASAAAIAAAYRAAGRADPTKTPLVADTLRGIARQHAAAPGAAPRPPAVQLAGGWRSAAMVARYASAVAVEDGAGARLFG